MSLTKTDIIINICQNTNLTKQESSEACESIIEIMKQVIESGNEIMINGFGKLSVQKKSERKGRNPATGKSLTLPARKVVTFKSSDKLKERLNNK